MDYSTSIHDSDNPVGASPWVTSPSTSPKAARTNFQPASGDAPPSPSPYASQQSSVGGYSQDDGLESAGFNRPESSAGGESVTDSDGHRPDTESDSQSVQQEPGSRKAEPQRYHPAARQAQKAAPGPQYKIQAKITGLERSGKKDPILRFDVHVSSYV